MFKSIHTLRFSLKQVTVVLFAGAMTLLAMIQGGNLLYSTKLSSSWGGFRGTILNKAPRKCAPWIPEKDRVVAFVSLSTMEEYYQPDGSKSGELYMSASLDYALRQNGFRVDTIWKSNLNSNTPHENEKLLSKYHRVFTNGLEIPAKFGVQEIPWEQRCKYRTFMWWGYRSKHENNAAGYNHRQFLLAFPESDFQSTFLGFFPHSLLWQQQAPSASRNKVALLLGKTSQTIEPLIPLLPTLIQNGFEIHSTCGDCELSNVTIHKNVGPFDFIKILQSSAVLIGSGFPFDSPSPLEGLANGVPFLNPILSSPDNFDLSSPNSLTAEGRPSQHPPLMMLGSPYVYNVHLDNHTQVLEAVMAAVDNRFASFVPPDYRVEALEARVCSILEDDALCRCSSPSNCWGSSILRNPPR